MSNEEEKKCPLCAEEMDWTDQQLNPCKCGYEVCVWCWHHIMDMAEKDATEGLCPACRTPYDKDRIVGLEANFQRVVANSSRKQKPPKAKAKPNEGRKDLSNVRVIQRKMAYIIGLPLDLADEELLWQKDYFGQYGKVTKVSLSRTAGGAVQQFINDTCSVYITYSKEEEAVRCIQSVHGYVLDDNLLRASFGTAKYCHAWLRNMPCNNPTCLYLHNIGAEEDSFGKDEVAAVHTRNRVQEIVGATQYLHKRSGSMLPLPVVDHLPSDSPEEPVCNNGLKDVAYATAASGGHLLCTKDKDGPVRSSKQTATFVDIVGRSCNPGSDKDVNLVHEGQMLNSWSNGNHVMTESSDPMILKPSTPSQLVNGVSRSKSYSEPFREASKRLLVDRFDSTLDGTNNTMRDNSAAFDDQRPKDLIPYPAKNYSDHAWWHHNQINVNSYVDEDSIGSTCTNSVANDGYNEKKFQSWAKSDRIYRCSNSFSNDEIVEHLRRLDDCSLVNNDENSAAVESSIISDILSMDLDGNDDLAFPQAQRVAGLYEARDSPHGSSWNFQNSDESRFSFAKEHGLGSSFSNIGQELNNFSVLQDSGENKDFLFRPQHQASRAQKLTPPGFSMPSKIPPGFSSCMRTEQIFPASSGSHSTRGSAPNNHYRSASIGNLSNGSDDIDPAMMIVGGGNSSSTNSWSSSQRSTSYDDDTKLWLFMQQQSAAAIASHHHHQHHATQFASSHDGGLTSGLADHHRQSYNPPSFANGYEQHKQLEEVGRLGVLECVVQMPSGGVYTRVFGM